MAKQSFLQTLKRLARHSWYGSADAKRAVPHALQQKIQSLIQASEAQHNGQIRVCIEAALPLSYIWRGLAARARAVTLFGKLRVWDTERNNGVLIYVLLAERKIEIIADRGLTQHVDNKTWHAVINEMRVAFKAKQFDAGLSFAISQVSQHLIAHFPDAAVRPNELPDSPVIQ
jgi:uncharacterized membrane protein